MKTVRYIALAALIAMASSAAAASGNHAGGHGHDADDVIGQPGVAAQATRSVNVDMTDSMRFTPANIHVRQNETVRFVITNSGRLKHELVLGTEKELKEHYEVMKKNPEMEHDDPNMVTVAPGQTGELIWQFTKAGKVDFACLQPGHYDAGMKGAVNVAKALQKPVAQAQPAASDAQARAGAANQAATTDLTDGEVRKVDKDNKKLTLKHGPLKNLDMPGMTMVFQVRDDAMLDKVEVGDKVRFRAEKIDGKITVTSIEAAR
jgi:uncharacterized cupredoxin-like copper-binding protein/Cu/Ag efflux protein CusF